MGYAVVQFTNWGKGKSIMAVPESWLFEKGKDVICHFPKVNGHKLIQQQAPVRADWKTFIVRRLTFKTICNYERALSKESEARYNSELDTDTDIPSKSVEKGDNDARGKLSKPAKPKQCRMANKVELLVPGSSAARSIITRSPSLLLTKPSVSSCAQSSVSAGPEKALDCTAGISAPGRTIPVEDNMQVEINVDSSMFMNIPGTVVQTNQVIDSVAESSMDVIPNSAVSTHTNEEDCNVAKTGPSDILGASADLDMQINDDDDNDEIIDAPPSSVRPQRTLSNMSQSSPSNTSQCTPLNTSQCIPSSTLQCTPLNTSQCNSSNTPLTQSNQNRCRVFVDSEKLDLILNKINHLQSLVEEHIEKSSSTHDHRDDLELEDFNLPVDTEEDLAELESKLKDKALRSKLRKLLVNCGGKHLAKAAKKMLEACITNSLACNYTLYGKKKFRGNFSSLLLYRVIRQACHRAFPAAPVDMVDNYIGSFLRHAPSKPGGSKYQKSVPAAVDHHTSEDDSD